MSLSKTEISGLYVSLFGRASENEGSKYWQNTKSDLASCADTMLKTSAAIDYFGNSLNSNQDFIEFIYLNTLNKTPDQDEAGINYWVGLLDSGKTKGEVVASLIHAIDSYAPGAINYDPSDAITVDAYNQYINRLTVSNYTADKLLITPSDYATSLSFNNDLIVTGDSSSVVAMVQNLNTKFNLNDIVATINTLNGTELNDTIVGTNDNDTIYGNDGDDTIRGGAGVDTMDGGAGNDTFIVVGDVTGGGKANTDADTAALGFELESLNFQNFNEDEDGAVETVIGGSGEDTLYLIGTTDASKYNISGIEHIEIRSDVTLSDNILAPGSVLKTITGDGSSILRITGGTAANPLVVDFSKTDSIVLSNLRQLYLDQYVEFVVDSLDILGGAKILTGTGQIKTASDAVDITLPDTYTVENGFKITNQDATKDFTGDAQSLSSIIGSDGTNVTYGTSGDDYLVGTDIDDTFYTKDGNDTVTGKKGNDTFVIDGTGKKILIDADEQNIGDGDILDLSQAQEVANINLSDGGTIGASTTIELGVKNAQGATSKASQNNVMIILDSSGSMMGTNMADAKAAALTLLDAYDNVGDVAVRLVDFDSYATSTFNGIDQWMSLDEAKTFIENEFYASGTTNYKDAIDVAETAYLSGKGSAYFDDGKDTIYFLSDGNPNYGIYSTQQQQWEDFLIDNQITANAIGFGGIYSTTYLQPVAFDGTKVVNSSYDHTDGQINPSITVDTSSLGTLLVDSANVDFMESVFGTKYNDVLIGNSLDNHIIANLGADRVEGLKGNDTLDLGIAGDVDTVVNRDIDNNGTDVILNFNSGEDKIELSTVDLNDIVGNTIFTAGANTIPTFSNFTDGAGSVDATHQYGTFIYNDLTGELIFDPLGNTSYDDVSKTMNDMGVDDIVIAELSGTVVASDIVFI